MKALALFSGGLDSMLAVKIIADMGIEVVALHIETGFGSRSDKTEILAKRAAMAGAKFRVVDIRDEYIDAVLLNPKYGYGKHFNPCIDCHGYMFKTAIGLLESEGASFIITGEVLGQRPMSQRKEALNSVLKLTGDEKSLILRPLSAKLLEPTTPEIEGWVDRERLFNISGRGRNTQMELAEKFGFDDYESPGGGCLLTLENFSNKLRDAIKFEKIQSKNDGEILKFGRHFRLEGGAKVIIGKDENDNAKLKEIKNEKFVAINLPSGVVGPFSYISKNATTSDKKMAARLILAYARSVADSVYEIQIDGENFSEKPLENRSEAMKFMVN